MSCNENYNSKIIKKFSLAGVSLFWYVIQYVIFFVSGVYFALDFVIKTSQKCFEQPGYQTYVGLKNLLKKIF